MNLNLMDSFDKIQTWAWINRIFGSRLHLIFFSERICAKVVKILPFNITWPITSFIKLLHVNFPQGFIKKISFIGKTHTLHYHSNKHFISPSLHYIMFRISFRWHCKVVNFSTLLVKTIFLHLAFPEAVSSCVF